MDICPRCGLDLDTLGIGSFPFCKGRPSDHGTHGITHSIITDDIPGGMKLENYGPHEVTVYSHTERKHLMAKNGLEMRERFSPMPGTDIDPAGIQNPKGYMDAYTLASAAVLLTRVGKQDTFNADDVIRNRFSLVAETDSEALAVLRIVNDAP